jgi:transcriptional regulator with XRE-family HTH domain
MTQAELAAPLSRAFVSAIEKGRTLPSLGALWLFAGRLGTGVGTLVDDVNGIDTAAYTPVHDEHGPRPHQRRDHPSAEAQRRR